jgi:hypothetical protein
LATNIPAIEQDHDLKKMRVTPDGSTPGKASYGETAAWILFCATSVHLTYLQPFIIIIPGERAKVISGLFCGLSLVAALVFAARGSIRISRLAAIISVVLAGLVILSGLFSLTPASSSVRGFALVTSALGGFWGARLLLTTQFRREFFLWLTVLMLIGVLFLSYLGYQDAGRIFYFFDSHWHPVADRIILFSFAPIALVLSNSRGLKLLGAAILILSYGVLLVGGRRWGMESAFFIPVVMLFIAVFISELRSANIARFTITLVVLFAMALTLGNHLYYRSSSVGKGHISVAYRVENVFFSCEIAKQHPLLGNGLLAPRNSIMSQYELHYPYHDKKHFITWTNMLRTSENIFFTFLADLGIPFTVLYILVVLMLLFALLRSVFHPPSASVIPPLALFLSISGALLHYQVLDGLVHPQLCWFFHVLLGLVPTTVPTESRSVKTGKTILLRIAVFALILTTGFILGRHFPEGFPLKYFGL